MNTERRERPDDETPPRQETEVWERLVRVIPPESGAGPAGSAASGESVTVERMRELLGSDTPPERPGH